MEEGTFLKQDLFVNNLEKDEYEEIFDYCNRSPDIEIVDFDDFDNELTLTFNSLQNLVYFVKYLSETYDNPEFKVLER